MTVASAHILYLAPFVICHQNKFFDKLKFCTIFLFWKCRWSRMRLLAGAEKARKVLAVTSAFCFGRFFLERRAARASGEKQTVQTKARRTRGARSPPRQGRCSRRCSRVAPPAQRKTPSALSHTLSTKHSELPQKGLIFKKGEIRKIYLY